MRYAVVIEAAGDNYSAYVPDLSGCVATGSTQAETKTAIREAIEFHLDGMREDGTPVPPALQPGRVCRGHCVAHRSWAALSKRPCNLPKKNP